MNTKQLELTLLDHFISVAELIREEEDPNKITGYLTVLAMHNLGMASFIELSAKELDKDKLNAEIDKVLTIIEKRKSELESISGKKLFSGPKGEA